MENLEDYSNFTISKLDETYKEFIEELKKQIAISKNFNESTSDTERLKTLSTISKLSKHCNLMFDELKKRHELVTKSIGQN